MNRFETIFQCPICSAAMGIVEQKSLICKNNHTFDLAKQGYVNLVTHPLATKYDKELFESRKLIAESGFFEPLCQTIVELITKEGLYADRPIKILDTGCGEGSHLSSIKEKLHSQKISEVVGVGVDLAKEGILAAARSFSDLIWCVADLANSPFKDNTFDVVLNILSPSNYVEFNRLLSDSGIVIKVVPRKDYLKELRDVFFDESNKQSYSNQNIVERFNANFDSFDKQSLTYTFTLNPSLLPHLIRMTPLSWAASEAKVQAILEMDLTEITVDLDILVGNYKNS
jgi:23S rRNA (guanine745-N1)-methyltransferase